MYVCCFEISFIEKKILKETAKYQKLSNSLVNIIATESQISASGFEQSKETRCTPSLEGLFFLWLSFQWINWQWLYPDILPTLAKLNSPLH